MLKRLFLKFGSWLAVLPVLLIPASVHAAFSSGLGNAVGNSNTVQATSGLGSTSSSANTLPNLIANVINILLGTLGIILVVIIIYAGILYMTAGGEDEKVKKAKKMITQGVIGLVLIIAAFAISSFVISQLVTLGNTTG